MKNDTNRPHRTITAIVVDNVSALGLAGLGVLTILVSLGWLP